MSREATGERQEAVRNPTLKTAPPRVTIIVAYALNRVIGKDGKVPWHLSGDLKRFRQLTMGHHIVMGRKTWESIGRLLPGRKHIIVSRQPDYVLPGAVVARTIEEALAACAGDNEIFVIGGEEIYRLVLPIAERIYATEIKADFAGDTVFPPFDPGTWVEVSREKGTNSESLPHDFVIYERAAVRR